MPTRYRCCERMEWTPVADFGHAAGVDLDLGRCGACGAYIMAVFYEPSTTYVVIPEKQAERFLSRRSDPAQLQQALKKWFES